MLRFCIGNGVSATRGSFAAGARFAMVGRSSMPPASPSVAFSPLDAARALAPQLAANAERIERERHLPADIVALLANAGLFRLCVPRPLGGEEADPGTLIDVIEILARADGASAWCVMIGATSGLLSGYLPPEAAREIYGSNPTVVSGGVFAPRGQATPTTGGYRVTGRWPFASGCQHCAWLMGGTVVLDDGKPRLTPSGVPDVRLMLFPASEVEIIDTWTVSGLCGTGSHDIAVRDVFVPAAHSASLITDAPTARGALYAFPIFGLLAIGIAAVGLGIARAAIDDLIALAGAKTPTGSRKRVADRPAIQADVAKAEAALGASRAYLAENVAAADDEARARSSIGTDTRARVRLAATHATVTAAKVVDLMYDAGGGTSVYETSPLQRRFRDVHVVTQHMMVAPATWELAGRLLLGVETDTSTL
jgi:indole-3-acetate monooxygenase